VAPLVPRWEWRTFGDRFGEADARFAALPAARVEESDELYLVSSADDANVKVRSDLLDVKVLQQVNADGLEQWKPAQKASFPIAAAELPRLFDALHVEAPRLARDAYSLEQLTTELVPAAAGLHVVRVHKKRTHYTVDGCMAELAEVRADGASTRTLAVESEDAAAVVAVVRSLGLGETPNVSYPRGLRTLLGLGAARYAVIDVGTNSVKFHVGERSASGAWRTVVDRQDVTRLGEGLAPGADFQQSAMERTAAAIADMADEARRLAVADLVAVGTMGMRTARNADAFVSAVRARSGVAIEVISGEEEGRLAYLAVQSGLGLARGTLVVFDTGGGSSQFTFGRGDEVSERFSVNVGAVRFTERFGLGGAVTAEALGAAKGAIAEELSRLDGRPTPDAIVGLGGAVTNLAAVKHALETYDPNVVQGTVLSREEIARQIDLYRARSTTQRQAIVGLQPKRADVILAGACIVETVLGKLGRDSLVVSDRGLRHGVLLDRFGSGPRAPRSAPI
jgi:exopolyphosphatase/guanosine-5'-triphosphate,3'-diphosphate pyrophosphatase